MTPGKEDKPVAKGHMLRLKKSRNRDPEQFAEDLLMKALDLMLSYIPKDLRINCSWTLILGKKMTASSKMQKSSYAEIVEYLSGKTSSLRGLQIAPETIVRYLLTSEDGADILPAMQMELNPYKPKKRANNTTETKDKKKNGRNTRKQRKHTSKRKS